MRLLMESLASAMNVLACRHATSARAGRPRQTRIQPQPRRTASPGKGGYPRIPGPAIIISQCNKKCTNFSPPGLSCCQGLRGRARGAARSCSIRRIRRIPTSWSRSGLGPAWRFRPSRPMNGFSGAGRQEPHRRLRADRARRADPCAPALRHRQRDGRQRGGRRHRGGRARHAVRHAAALSRRT